MMKPRQSRYRITSKAISELRKAIGGYQTCECGHWSCLHLPSKENGKLECRGNHLYMDTIEKCKCKGFVVKAINATIKNNEV